MTDKKQIVCPPCQGVNTEAAQQISARFQIRSILTMIVFKNGKEVARQSGAMNKAQIMQWISFDIALITSLSLFFDNL